MKREVAGVQRVASLAEQVYGLLRSMLRAQDFEPGDRLVDSTLAKLLNVSRTPVREALNRLAAEGYLELHPRRGAMVRPLSGAELRDLYEVRDLIESHAVRAICRDGRPVPPEMAALCDAHEALPAEEHLRHVEINRLFHRALVAGAGNTVLLQVFDGLQANLTRVAMLSLRQGVGRNEVIEHEHRALIAALEAHDEAHALSVLDRHLKLMPRLMAALPG